MQRKNGITVLLGEESAQADFGSVYMIIVFIIAALLLITVIKPMFRQSQQVVASKFPAAAPASASK